MIKRENRASLFSAKFNLVTVMVSDEFQHYSKLIQFYLKLILKILDVVSNYLDQEENKE